MLLYIITIALSINTATSYDCEYTSNVSNVCFGFPNQYWITPTPVQVNLTCGENETLQLEEITFMRPAARNDYRFCYRRRGSFNSAYNEETCCEIWNGRHWAERYDRCNVPLQVVNKTKFEEYSAICNNSTECQLELEAAILDQYCDNLCNSANINNPNIWCWSRRVEVRYKCLKDIKTSTNDEGVFEGSHSGENDSDGDFNGTKEATVSEGKSCGKFNYVSGKSQS